MKPQLLLAALAVVVTLSATRAQQAPSRTVTIHTIGQQVPITDPSYAFANVYFLSNGGANALAISTDDGIVLIDAKLAGWGKATLDTLNQVTNEPVVRIIHTNATIAGISSAPVSRRTHVVMKRGTVPGGTGPEVGPALVQQARALV